MDTVTVFLAAGGRCKKAELQAGRGYAELRRLYLEAFYVKEERDVPSITEEALNPGSFSLRHMRYGVAYEGWGPEDVYPGAVFEVKDPVLEDEAALKAEFIEHLKRNKGLGTAFLDHLGDTGEAKSPVTPPPWQELGAEAEAAAGPQTFKEKVWVLMDDPTSSTPAMLLTVFNILLIVFSTITFCMETLPWYYDHDASTSSVWYIMEAVCIAIFSADLLVRTLSCPDKWEFFGDTMNCIDVIAIMPFYLEAILGAIMGDVEIPGLAVFRVIRLVRVFRLFKVSRGSLMVFVDTMTNSAKPLYMLIFFTSLAMIVFSSLIYYAERGVWNEDLELWMRELLYMCRIDVNVADAAGLAPADFPVSSWVPHSGLDQACYLLDPQPAGVAAERVAFMCPYSFDRGGCTKFYEQSPFDSIPGCFWWCMVTMTTVGYGDMYPTLWYGKFLAIIVMLIGMLVIALPITVIGSNFSQVFKSSVLETEDDE